MESTYLPTSIPYILRASVAPSVPSDAILAQSPAGAGRSPRMALRAITGRPRGGRLRP